MLRARRAQAPATEAQFVRRRQQHDGGCVSVRFTLLAVLGTAVLAPAALAAQDPQLLTAADLTIARIPLKADSGMIRQMLGAPDSVARGEDPSESGQFSAWWYRDLEVLIGRNGAVIGKWIRGASRSTARGLRIGATQDDVLRIYGPPRTSIGPSMPLIVYRIGRRDGSPGLFIYLSGGHVSAIYAGYQTD